MVHILERDGATIQDHFQYYFGNINSSCVATNVYTISIQITSTKIHHNLKHSEN